MFESSLLIGRIRGIRIQVHFTWLVIFALLSVSLIANFRVSYPEWGDVAAVTAAFLAVLLFFTSIVLHELGHSLVALARGVPVRSITLFIFGGVAQLEKDSESARDEFWIAIAGPMVSAALAVFFYLLAFLTSRLHEPAAVVFFWLAFINFAVAAFNMLPGFPLDGGRVLRALVWHLSGDAHKGVDWAVTGGRLIAIGLMGIGVYLLIVHGFLLAGLWMVAIGWFLLNAAEASGKSYSFRRALGGVQAADLMEHEPPMVPAETSIGDWIQDRVLPTGSRAWMVAGNGKPAGLVTLSDSRRILRERWPDTPVRQIMTPTEKLRCVQAGAGMEEVLQIMSRHGLNQVPVMDGDRLVGWIDRERLLRGLRIRLELEGRSIQKPGQA